MKEADALAARGTWHLFEWCCEPDSLLSAWFQDHGQAATRLGLPQHDMSLRESVQKVVRQVRELASGGTNVLLWAALPCMPWSAWQRVNCQLSAATARHVDDIRNESWTMLALYCLALRQVLDVRPASDKGAVHAVFEWPQGAFAEVQRIPEMAQLLAVARRMLLPRVHVMGCRARALLKKPWRVQSSLTALREPLSRKCDHMHVHRKTRGLDAVQSGRYTPCLVEQISRVAGLCLAQGVASRA